MVDPEELRDLLAALNFSDEGGITTQELADMLGLNRSTVSIRLRKLFLAGKLEATRRRIPAADGKMASVPAYRLKP